MRKGISPVIAMAAAESQHSSLPQQRQIDLLWTPSTTSAAGGPGFAAAWSVAIGTGGVPGSGEAELMAAAGASRPGPGRDVLCRSSMSSTSRC
jgi:hypothetical protein